MELRFYFFLETQFAFFSFRVVVATVLFLLKGDMFLNVNLNSVSDYFAFVNFAIHNIAPMGTMFCVLTGFVLVIFLSWIMISSQN